jgi:hypothetical protein
VASADPARACTRIFARAVVLASLIAAPIAVEAQDAPAAPAPAAHRAVPDYDSREAPASDVEDALRWIPRVLTSPLYLVSEVFLRGPLGVLARWAEDARVVQSIIDFFTFGPNDDIMILPTLFADFGFLPSVGLTGRWRNFLGPSNRLSAQLTTFGVDFLSARGAITIFTGGDVSVFAQGGYLRRPDLLLGGQLLDPPQTTNARYAIERGDAEIGYTLRAHGRSSVGASVVFQTASFGDTSYGPDPSIVALVNRTGATLPPGFAHGYSVGIARVHAAIDTRMPIDVPAAGVRLALYGDLAMALSGLPGSRWFRFGGDALAATDVLGGRRILSLGLDVSAIVPTSGSTLPFDQSIDLGGLGPMPGFLPGQVRGGSAVALTLGYEWPVWAMLHARLYAAFGNAFGLALEGFSIERMRMSFGLSFHPPDTGDQPFEAGIGIGTEPIADGADIASVRAYLGLRHDL